MNTATKWSDQILELRAELERVKRLNDALDAENYKLRCEKIENPDTWELERVKQSILGLKASMRLIADRLKQTGPIVDFLNANNAPKEVKTAWKELVYTSGIRAQMEAELDPNEYYVSREQVQPLVDALQKNLNLWDLRECLCNPGRPITECSKHRAERLLKEALTHARTLGFK